MSARHPLTRSIRATKRDVQRALRLLHRCELRLDVLLRLRELTPRHGTVLAAARRRDERRAREDG